MTEFPSTGGTPLRHPQVSQGWYHQASLLSGQSRSQRTMCNTLIFQEHSQPSVCESRGRRRQTLIKLENIPWRCDWRSGWRMGQWLSRSLHPGRRSNMSRSGIRCLRSYCTIAKLNVSPHNTSVSEHEGTLFLGIKNVAPPRKEVVRGVSTEENRTFEGNNDLICVGSKQHGRRRERIWSILHLNCLLLPLRGGVLYFLFREPSGEGPELFSYFVCIRYVRNCIRDTRKSSIYKRKRKYYYP